MKNVVICAIYLYLWKLQNTNQIIPYGPTSRLYSVCFTLVFIHFDTYIPLPTGLPTKDDTFETTVPNLYCLFS